MKTYQYASSENTVVSVIDDDGISRMSMLASLVPEVEPILPYVAPPLTQSEIDGARYRLRAEARDGILAYLQIGNEVRVREGTWNSGQLKSLMKNADVVEAFQSIGTLSYEAAIEAITASNNPLLTEQIKADWIAHITSHLYAELP